METRLVCLTTTGVLRRDQYLRLVRAARQLPPRGCQATARRREVLSVETDDGILSTAFDQGIGKGFARPKQTWHDAPESDLAVLAAAYAFGVANAHPYNDATSGPRS